MNCQNCGQPLSEGATFCGNCGAQIQQTTAPAPSPVTLNPAPLEQTPAAVAPVVASPSINEPVAPTPSLVAEAIAPSPVPSATPSQDPVVPAPMPAAPSLPQAPPAPVQMPMSQSQITSLNNTVSPEIEKSKRLVSLLALIYGGINLVAILQIAYQATTQNTYTDSSALVGGLVIAAALVGAIIYFAIKLRSSSSLNDIKKNNMLLMIISGVIIALLVSQGQNAGLLTIVLLIVSIQLHMKLSKTT